MAPGTGLRRRALLAGTAGTLAATSGCLRDLRNIMGRDRPQQMSITIVTMPAAADAYAVRLANELRDNLQAVGVDATVDIMEPDVLLREILVNQNFDVYVGRYHGGRDPDELRSLLLSTYSEEAGWQNPFGFSSISMDDLLEEQRLEEGDDRVQMIHQLQRQIIEEQPFTVVAAPYRLAAIREDRFDSWGDGGAAEPIDYLEVRRVGEADTLEMVLRDDRITRNRNPIAAEHRDASDVTGLLYEPLVRRIDDEATPWLARHVEWDDDDELSATVTLRETPWHDGETVTAGDVAFTYAFLEDTSLGEFDTPAPTSWRRGRVSLVDDVEVQDGTTVRMTFQTPVRAVAERALTVPVLPEHVWRERSDVADIGPIDVAGETTEALVTPNDEAIGSGPLRVEDATPDEELVLDVFDEHFLFSGADEDIPDRFHRTPQFETIRFTVAPSHDAAIELLDAGEADATADGLQAGVVERVVENPDLSLSVGASQSFYHVGYNTRRWPMSDPQFRRRVSKLLDREYLDDEVFDGYSDPRQTLLEAPWVPEELEWDGVGRLPFYGEDGELDVDVARAGFREAGFRYEGEEIVRRGES